MLAPYFTALIRLSVLSHAVRASSLGSRPHELRFRAASLADFLLEHADLCELHPPAVLAHLFSLAKTVDDASGLLFIAHQLLAIADNNAEPTLRRFLHRHLAPGHPLEGPLTEMDIALHLPSDGTDGDGDDSDSDADGSTVVFP